MYLDDGVSRDSAPLDLPQYKYANKDEEWEDTEHKSEAQGVYRQVNFVQVHTLQPVSQITRLTMAAGLQRHHPSRPALPQVGRIRSLGHRWRHLPARSLGLPQRGAGYSDAGDRLVP